MAEVPFDAKSLVIDAVNEMRTLPLKVYFQLFDGQQPDLGSISNLVMRENITFIFNSGLWQLTPNKKLDAVAAARLNELSATPSQPLTPIDVLAAQAEYEGMFVVEEREVFAAPFTIYDADILKYVLYPMLKRSFTNLLNGADAPLFSPGVTQIGVAFRAIPLVIEGVNYYFYGLELVMAREVLPPGRLMECGHVVGDNGAPVPGLAISIMDEPAVTTAENGSYCLEMPASIHVLDICGSLGFHFPSSLTLGPQFAYESMDLSSRFGSAWRQICGVERVPLTN